ncbi:peptidase domain-containing ABC transporter [Shewanella sp. CG12_big_fil_rev_8_21_14_0_65_47_15]|uniref:peptidase domain-containing ABC transporter n=1 Tax=Shewanella sp. CG12_big_fil_rev_8_21_14_0_65_47_15 TaxID=1975537 RepID=UPI000CBBE48D|nr:peptidase domain-containing ABC transporter [Shewanella sp. CG12_big_fil_rev_8_21_14_0_65_47_15]PIW60069.1 MAG: antibiotic ABC transporter [Shewanella sp. CG12_big_fil_rev_8_21_14_0_65_47_15]
MQVSDYIQFGHQKLPVYLQSEVAECGITCIAMAACYHGFKTNMLAMRQKYPTGLHGITVKQIITIAGEIGLSARVLKLDLGQLAKVKKPAILHWNFNHFVTLAEVSSKGVTIHDPAKGKLKLDWNQVSEAFTGIVIELVPSSEFIQKDERIKVPLRQFIGRVDGLWLSLGKIFFIALLLQALLLISPYYIRVVIDQGINVGQTSILWSVFVGFLLVLLLSSMAQVIRAAAIMYLDKSLSFQVKANIQRHLLHLPLSFFESRHVGDIKSRFEAFSEVQRLISRGFITALVDGLLSVTTICIMFQYQSSLAFVSIAFLLVLYLGRFLLTHKENEHLEQSLSKHAKENSHFIETIRAIMPIKCFAKENNRLSHWMNLYADSLNASIKREKIIITTDVFQNVLGKLEYLLIVLIGAHFIIEQSLSLGMFLAFLAYRQQFADSAQSLVDNLFRFKIAGTYLRRMSDIVMQPTEQELPSLPLNISHIRGRIEVRDIHFRYSKAQPWLFTELNFHVDAGESVAIIGRSGLGKTTLLKIMTGLIQTEHGEVLLDDMPIKNIGLRQFRQNCATVMQNDQLFNGSLLENICFFEPTPNMEKIKEAIKGAAIWDEIQAMPMGLHAQVGDLGSALSGGQKQRILLARALYTQPKILFLDEATSHLDAATELKVNQYLKQKHITRISVAHRQETIAAADRVIDLSILSNVHRVA